MRHFNTLLLHELRMLLIAPATYVAAVLYSAMMALIYALALYTASENPQENLPAVQFFQTFWLPVMFMVPLLTMRSIAEERRLGTLETLMTTPTTAFQVVLSKFFSAYILYLVLWGLTLLFPLIASSASGGAIRTADLVSRASLIGGYGYIAISGLTYVAIGIFASSLTRSQLVAGMLSFSLLFILLISGQFFSLFPFLHADLPFDGRLFIDYLHTFRHLDDFSRGVLDSRPLFLYSSVAALLLGLTTLVTESKA